MNGANVEQAAAWNGHEGEHWTEYADRYDRAVAAPGSASWMPG